jgi:AcrR family transcriptional regulator
MPNRTTAKIKAAFAADSVTRRPQQGRSKASLERLLAAAEKLMIERGNEDFTLHEVSKEGNVSIGSIYLRFESKENLVRAVIAAHLEHIAIDEARMISLVSERSADLAGFISNYVSSYAEFLHEHAPMLRLSMNRAQHDPLVSGPGKEAATRAARVATEGMLAYTSEFGGSNPSLKAHSAFDVIFSTLARHLSLGSSAETADELDWKVLKVELANMCLAYLKHPI